LLLRISGNFYGALPYSHKQLKIDKNHLICLPQRSLPDLTQHLKWRGIHAPGGIPTTNPTKPEASIQLPTPLGFNGNTCKNY